MAAVLLDGGNVRSATGAAPILQDLPHLSPRGTKNLMAVAKCPREQKADMQAAEERRVELRAWFPARPGVALTTRSLHPITKIIYRKVRS